MIRMMVFDLDPIDFAEFYFEDTEHEPNLMIDLLYHQYGPIKWNEIGFMSTIRHDMAAALSVPLSVHKNLHYIDMTFRDNDDDDDDDNHTLCGVQREALFARCISVYLNLHFSAHRDGTARLYLPHRGTVLYSLFM
jgi:hypothetical protein